MGAGGCRREGEVGGEGDRGDGEEGKIHCESGAWFRVRAGRKGDSSWCVRRLLQPGVEQRGFFGGGVGVVLGRGRTEWRWV